MQRIVNLVVQFFMRKLVSLCLYAYFSEIKILGLERIPSSGPVIIAGNHPNMALDPCLLGCSIERSQFRFWAKSTLFRGTLNNLFMRALGCVPVHRSSDSNGQQVSNESMYKATYEELADGNVLILFPEGKSYTDSALQPLKKGVAWLVTGLIREKGINVPIVPAGLNYSKKDKFRSSVLIEFGEPMTIEFDASMSREEEKEIVASATKELEDAMDALLITAPDWETMNVLRTARAIYATGNMLNLQEHVKLQRRFNHIYKENKDRPEVEALLEEIKKYHYGVHDEMGLRDYHFSENFSAAQTLKHSLWAVLQIILLLPIAIPALIIHAPVYYLTKFLHNNTKHEEDKSTFKVTVLLIFVPSLDFVTLLALYLIYGWKVALFVLVLLPLLQYFHLKMLENSVQTWRSLKLLQNFFQALLSKSKRVDELRDMRKNIKQQLDKLADVFYPDKEKRIIHSEQEAAMLRKRKSSVRFNPTTAEHFDKYV